MSCDDQSLSFIIHVNVWWEELSHSHNQFDLTLSYTYEQCNCKPASHFTARVNVMKKRRRRRRGRWYRSTDKFFKVPCGHIKASKWHLKGPQATSKWYALLVYPVAAMGKCKQINNSNLQYVSDVISLIIHEKNYTISLMPCFLP